MEPRRQLIGCADCWGGGWSTPSGGLRGWSRCRVVVRRRASASAPVPRRAITTPGPRATGDRAPSSRLPGCRDRHRPRSPSTSRVYGQPVAGQNRSTNVRKEAAMKGRRCARPLLTLLARLGWQPDPQTWTVRCWDLDGHRRSVRVSMGERGPQISFDRPGTAEFDPLAAGRLRAALRDAIELHATLSNLDYSPNVRQHPGPVPTPHAAWPTARCAGTEERVRITLSSAVGDDARRGRHARHAAVPPSPQATARTDVSPPQLREVA